MPLIKCLYKFQYLTVLQIQYKDRYIYIYIYIYIYMYVCTCPFYFLVCCKSQSCSLVWVFLMKVRIVYFTATSLR